MSGYSVCLECTQNKHDMCESKEMTFCECWRHWHEEKHNGKNAVTPGVREKS